ncbi:DASH complex subunit spc19 [Microbotryomycetes sp. JL201]|nr:DASH complex subunit spc19 [Microbotryomycetes sp. JL201]
MSRARQSVYPAPPAPVYWSALESCSSSLQLACASLNNATSTLDQGTFDFPRLATVVQSRRAFDLVTESEVQDAQRSLAAEMGPQITELIDRAEAGLEQVKKRERALKAKVEKRAAVPARPHAEPPNISALERQLKSLQKKKDMLSTTVDRLDRQADALRAK